MTRLNQECVKVSVTAGRNARSATVPSPANAALSLSSFTAGAARGSRAELDHIEQYFRANPQLSQLRDEKNILTPDQLTTICETLQILSPLFAQQKIRQARDRGLAPPEDLSACPARVPRSFQVKVYQARGYHQSVDRLPCQDTVLPFARLEGRNQLVGAIVNDGVSCIPLAHMGSRFLALVLKDSILRRSADWPATHSLLDARFLGGVHADICFECVSMASNLGISLEKGARLLFGSTLQVLLAMPRETIGFGLSDGYLGETGRLVNVLAGSGRPRFAGDVLPPPLLLQSLRLGYGTGNRAVPLPLLPDDAPAWKAFLAREATAFYIHFYSHGADAAKVTIASDGVRHVSGKELPVEDRRLFPFDVFCRHYHAEDLGHAVTLWNLAARQWRDSETGRLVRDTWPKSKKGARTLPLIGAFNDVLEYQEVAETVEGALKRLKQKHAVLLRSGSGSAGHGTPPLDELNAVFAAMLRSGKEELKLEIAREISNLRRAVWLVFEKQFPPLAKGIDRTEICRIWDDLSIVHLCMNPAGPAAVAEQHGKAALQGTVSHKLHRDFLSLLGQLAGRFMPKSVMSR